MLCCVSGVGAGVFGSLVGLGGAFVMIPALTGVLKASQHQAHGKQPQQSSTPPAVSLGPAAGCPRSRSSGWWKKKRQGGSS